MRSFIYPVFLLLLLAGPGCDDKPSSPDDAVTDAPSVADGEGTVDVPPPGPELPDIKAQWMDGMGPEPSDGADNPLDLPEGADAAGDGGTGTDDGGDADCTECEVCGDGWCGLGESCANCPEDCGNNCAPCGDGVCSPGEKCYLCPQDCGDCCGNGECGEGEDCLLCPQDCGTCCPNGACDFNETCSTCPADCGDCCGDGWCSEDEDCYNGPADCGGCCGNGLCDFGESCAICPADCGPCCPNGLCAEDENCATCPADCGACCGNGACDFGETCATCPGDCGVCPPPPGTHAFHIVHIDDAAAWDSIWALAQAHPDPGPMICSQNKHPGVPFNMWAQKINATWYGSGEEMADAIHGAFSAGANAPLYVMIDELNGGTIGLIAGCASKMKTAYPQWAGRWGAYLVNGTNVSYANLNPAVDELLTAQAIVGVEMYPKQSAYCAGGNNAGARDQWLADFFRGTQGQFPQARFHWLMERRTALGSNSHITVLFGVTDAYMNGTNPAIFLDRMFYVWRNKSGYGSILLLANGGVGAFKWDQPDMSNTSRDQAFAESFNHYCVAGNAGSLKGQVPCP